MSNIVKLMAGLIILFTAGIVNAAAITYTYDNLHRLTRADYRNGTVIEYSCDAAGNRLAHKVSHQTVPVNSFTSVGENVTVSPARGTTITFSEISSSGYTTVNTANIGPNPPDGFQIGNMPVYYEITTTATYPPSCDGLPGIRPRAVRQFQYAPPLSL